jgi:hypothetical protein
METGQWAHRKLTPSELLNSVKPNSVQTQVVSRCALQIPLMEGMAGEVEGSRQANDGVANLGEARTGNIGGERKLGELERGDSISKAVRFRAPRLKASAGVPHCHG